MRADREPGISPEASRLFDGLRSFLHDSADLTGQQLFYLTALQKATFCRPDVIATIDAGVTEEIEVNTTLASSVASLLTSLHPVALAIEHDGEYHKISGLGYSTETVSYVALIGNGNQDNQGLVKRTLNPDELSCRPLRNPKM